MKIFPRFRRPDLFFLKLLVFCIDDEGFFKLEVAKADGKDIQVSRCTGDEDRSAPTRRIVGVVSLTCSFL